MTNLRSRRPLLLAAMAALSAFPMAAAGLTLDAALAKIDQAAKSFKGLSASIQTVQHMEAIHEDDSQSGTILVKRAGHGDLHLKVSIDQPEKKIAVSDGKKVRVYYPSSGEIQEKDLGQSRSMLDMILALGFGGSAKELQADYTVSLGGPATLGGEAATRLQLIPKLKDMLEQWKKIDLWISDKTGYAIQQKFYEAGDDYMLITYSNVQPKTDLPDSDFNLNAPKGTKKEHIDKKR
jgi:outer membrane lipoprotein-sorting protein